MSVDTQIQTYTGFHFDFEDLENNHYRIADIAHALSQQCRWTGHTKYFYSVAQHSCYAYEKALEQYGWSRINIVKEALLHDASEYVLTDLSRPLKTIMPDYQKKQKELEEVMGRKFGIPHIMSPEVKEIDDRLLITEYRQLISDPAYTVVHPHMVDFYLKPYSDISIKYWSPEAAEERFTKYFETITWRERNAF